MLIEITFKRLQNRNNKCLLEKDENNVHETNIDLHGGICEPLELGSEPTAVDCS